MAKTDTVRNYEASELLEGMRTLHAVFCNHNTYNEKMSDKDWVDAVRRELVGNYGQNGMHYIKPDQTYYDLTNIRARTQDMDILYNKVVSAITTLSNSDIVKGSTLALAKEAKKVATIFSRSHGFGLAVCTHETEYSPRIPKNAWVESDLQSFWFKEGIRDDLLTMLREMLVLIEPTQNMLINWAKVERAEDAVVSQERYLDELERTLKFYHTNEDKLTERLNAYADLCQTYNNLREDGAIGQGNGLPYLRVGSKLDGGNNLHYQYSTFYSNTAKTYDKIVDELVGSITKQTNRIVQSKASVATEKMGMMAYAISDAEQLLERLNAMLLHMLETHEAPAPTKISNWSRARDNPFVHYYAIKYREA